MFWVCTLALATAGWPLGRALWANRRTTLLQALLWAAGAWAAWLLVFVGAAVGYDADVALGRHLALALAGGAGVAVLGARRPGVGCIAWRAASATSCSRRASKNGLPETRSASARC